MDFLTSTTHIHITTWVIGLVLFFVAAFAAKPPKAVQMILRVFYLLIIATGALLFFEHRDTIVAANGSGMAYDMKFLFGILLIGGMEMVLGAKSKGKKPTVGWIMFVISLLAVFFIGLGGAGTTIGFNIF